MIMMKNISILLFLLGAQVVAQTDILFENARAYQIELKEVKVLAVSKNYGPGRVSAQFFDDNDQLLYGYRSREGGAYRQKVSLMRLPTKVIHSNFNGSNIRAISPDGNRVLLNSSIYDMEQGKTFKLNITLLDNIAWLDDDKIYTYNGTDKYRTTLPTRFYYVDLNDLQSKSMTQVEMTTVLERINNKQPYHPNIYLSQASRSGSIYINDQKTPYAKTLVPFKNGYPIKWYITSPNLKYLVVLKGSERYANSSELVLYELIATATRLTTRYTISNPSKYFGERFKKEYDTKGAVGMWVDVYEAKINPLNDRKIGANTSTYKGNMKVVEVRADGSWVLEIGYQSQKIKTGYVVTNFRRGKSLKDSRGTWTTLKE